MIYNQIVTWTAFAILAMFFSIKCLELFEFLEMLNSSLKVEDKFYFSGTHYFKCLMTVYTLIPSDKLDKLLQVGLAILRIANLTFANLLAVLRLTRLDSRHCASLAFKVYTSAEKMFWLVCKNLALVCWPY